MKKTLLIASLSGGLALIGLTGAIIGNEGLVRADGDHASHDFGRR